MIARESILLVLLSLVLAGCSTKLLVHDISGTTWADPSNAAPVNDCNQGIPFRTLASYNAQLYQKTEDGFAAIDKPKVFLIPDHQKLYTLNFQSQYFSNNTFKLTLHDDGTIDKVETTEAIQADKAIEALGGFATKVSGEAVDYERNRKKREREDIEEEVNYWTQKKKLRDAQTEYNALPSP